MQHLFFRVGFFLLVGLLVFSVGCGSGGTRRGAYGTVTLDEEPVKAGSITFFPINETQKSPVIAGSMVVEGRYSIENRLGLEPGKHKVVIKATQFSGKKTKRGNHELPMMVDIVPEEYGKKSTQIVEITSRGPNKFDFHMKSKP